MSSKSLFLFITQAIVLFLLLLFLLYWAAPVYHFFLAQCVEPVLKMIYPRFISEVSAHGYTLEVVTNFAVAGQPQGRLAFDINPLKYTYGLPLFLALLISSREFWKDKVWHALIGLFILLIAQTWSLCFDIARNLLYGFQGAYAAYFDYGAFGSTIISLGSQLGFLLFPSLIPIMIWVFLIPDFFRQLTQLKEKKTGET